MVANVGATADVTSALTATGANAEFCTPVIAGAVTPDRDSDSSSACLKDSRHAGDQLEDFGLSQRQIHHIRAASRQRLHPTLMAIASDDLAGAPNRPRRRHGPKRRCDTARAPWPTS
jgi:hypothetical protein